MVGHTPLRVTHRHVTCRSRQATLLSPRPGPAHSTHATLSSTPHSLILMDTHALHWINIHEGRACHAPAAINIHALL
ncbi:hypothetical protein E2C01_092535 [Portunus trituberculatus]|uniref:Uncharacterized protein n=1 Tax=Portunus trituberculatus TaxID=210409 RepID=A0A5B7JGP9_PORTR|nr:hypothetical protein [Portunus trituberculatus]